MSLLDPKKSKSPIAPETLEPLGLHLELKLSDSAALRLRLSEAAVLKLAPLLLGVAVGATGTGLWVNYLPHLFPSPPPAVSDQSRR